MKLKETLEIEHNKKQNQIILFKEGSFWRAYEISAFICCNYNPQTSLKPTKRNYKDINEECIFIGFPISSVSKYLPNIDNKVSYNDDVSIMTIDISEFLYNYNGDIDQDFKCWKSECNSKLKDSSENSSKKNNNSNDRYYKLLLEIQEIISYPLESKTMIENTLFISNIKQKFLKLI